MYVCKLAYITEETAKTGMNAQSPCQPVILKLILDM